VNVTVPVVTGLPDEVTVAVNVVAEPVWLGFTDEVTAVAVAAAATLVVIVKLQPPAIARCHHWCRRVRTASRCRSGWCH
jgi:hypothetical protein